MSGYELNKAIAEALGWKVLGKSIFSESEIYVRKEIGPRFRVDYCGNWNDLMPLVVEYKIMDIFLFTKTATSMQDNLQRALAECLLTVLKNKQLTAPQGKGPK